MSSCGRRQPDRPALIVLATALLAILLSACDTTPVLRGSGSEHRQSIRIGLPL